MAEPCVEINPEMPNGDTVDALNEYHEMIEHPDRYKRYSTFRKLVGEVMKDIDAAE